MVLDHMQVLDEMQDFCLRPARAMHHAVYPAAEFVQHLFDHRGIRTGRGQHQTGGIERSALYRVGQVF